MLFSNSTGIINVSEAVKKFDSYFYQKIIPVLEGKNFKTSNRKGDEFNFTVDSEEVLCEEVINRARLSTITFREMLGLHVIENYWVQGRYLKWEKKFLKVSKKTISLSIMPAFEAKLSKRYLKSNTRTFGSKAQ